MPGCALLHRATSCWKALKTGAILERELGNAWKLRVGGGLSALQTWSATPLGSREVGFSNLCYMSLVIAKIDHLRWKYRWICCWWQLTRTLLSIQVHWYAYLLYWKKKIISSSTLGCCFCRIGICYFIPTCCSNISSPDRLHAMKSSEEHRCRANCCLARLCLVIARWIARLAQAQGVCIRNREGDFSLLLPAAISYQSLCLL